MRKFTQAEINFIMDNEEKKPLKDLAETLGCSWKDIYDVYSKQISKPAFQEKMRLRGEKASKSIQAAKDKKRLKNILERIGEAYEETRKDKE